MVLCVLLCAALLYFWSHRISNIVHGCACLVHSQTKLASSSSSCIEAVKLDETGWNGWADMSRYEQHICDGLETCSFATHLQFGSWIGALIRAIGIQDDVGIPQRHNLRTGHLRESRQTSSKFFQISSKIPGLHSERNGKTWKDLKHQHVRNVENIGSRTQCRGFHQIPSDFSQWYWLRLSNGSDGSDRSEFPHSVLQTAGHTAHWEPWHCMALSRDVTRCPEPITHPTHFRDVRDMQSEIQQVFATPFISNFLQICKPFW